MFVLIFLKLNKRNGESFNNRDYLIVRDRCRNPVITMIEHFAIIVNSFSIFAIIAKSPIVNAVGFLDSPLHCNKSAAKAIGCLKLKKMVMLHAYLRLKYFNNLEKHILGGLILLNLQH